MKINQYESKIATIQDHIGRQNEICTLSEDEIRIADCRKTIHEVKQSKEKLEASLAHIIRDR